VIARNTAFTYKGKSVDAKQIGRELGVRYLLDGSVRRTGDQVRVNVRLIDAESGVQLWADRFDTDRANLAAAQDEITGRLARTFNLELVEDLGRRIEQEGAVDPPRWLQRHCDPSRNGGRSSGAGWCDAQHAAHGSATAPADRR